MKTMTLAEARAKLLELEQQETKRRMTRQQVIEAAESILESKYSLHELCMNPLKPFSENHVFEGNDVTNIINSLVDDTLYHSDGIYGAI